MSRIIVNIEGENAQRGVSPRPFLAEHARPEKPGIFLKVMKIIVGLILVFALLGGIGGFIYWQYLKSTPQYSLALLVDAARRDDQPAIDELVDTDAVVDDFLPQIVDKAVEMYGRGLPKEKVRQMAQAVAPILPSVKDRARQELPELIREKTSKFENYPFWAIAVGARRYLEINEEGDTAFIKSKIESRPLELTLKKKNGRWQVVGVRDEVLAQRIAEKVGQEIIALVNVNGVQDLENAGKNLGVENLQDIFNKAKDILR